jgi:uncharacterized membrane protein YphA (DoxX/SURF4 family)
MNARKIGYWVATAIIALVMLGGGAADLFQRKEAVEEISRLGYPLYFASILGFWKMLGGIAVLAPRLPRLKEWAYAGIFFDLTGAAASHVANGDGIGHIVWPALFAVLTIVSWALRPPDRVVGQLLPART